MTTVHRERKIHLLIAVGARDEVLSEAGQLHTVPAQIFQLTVRPPELITCHRGGEVGQVMPEPGNQAAQGLSCSAGVGAASGNTAPAKYPSIEQYVVWATVNVAR